MKNSYLIALVLVAALCAAVFGYYKFVKPSKVAKVDTTSTPSEFPTTPHTADDIPGARTSSLDPAGPAAGASQDDPFASNPGTGSTGRVATGATTTTQPSNQSVTPIPGSSNLGSPSGVKVVVGPTMPPTARSSDPIPPTDPMPRGQVATGPTKAGTYTIKAGDVLSVVSKEQLGSAKLWRKIVAANPGLDPDHLKVGQVITLPEVASKTAAPARMPLSSPDHLTSTASHLENSEVIPVANPINAGGTHIVTTGETLSSIAREVYPHGGGSWKTLYAANRNALGNNPNGVRIGMTLVIPASR